MKKKILLLFAALLPLVASAQTKVEIDGIWYNLTAETSEAEVTFKGDYYYSYDEYSGSITLPATVTHEGTSYSVTSIGDDAFYKCSSLTTITLPEGVTSIGDYAFRDCSSLTDITIPESVTSIGDYAFDGTEWYNNQPDGVVYIGKVLYKYKGTMPENTVVEVKEGTVSIGGYAFDGCSSLTSITIPEGVTSIGYVAFSGCRSLTAITIPEGVTSIADQAFYNCSSLTAITIPKSVTSIGSSAFRGCSGLTSIILPEGVTSIGHTAFSYCISLTAITIPEGVTSIGSSAFRGCSGLTSIILPEGVTSIGNYTFEDCSGLTAITIPEDVTSIGDKAFSGCSGLTAITIPEGVTSIGDYAFDGCSSLTAVHISSIEAWCKILFEDSDSNPLYYAHNLYLNGELVTELVIPEGVTSIGSYAFAGCSSLTAITIPESVTSIGSEAFSDCSRLTAITLPESVTSIGSSAFRGCSSLTSIILPEGVTSIGKWAFDGCSGLTAITIPASVTSIGSSAFRGCSLTSITIPENSQLTGIEKSTFEGCSSLKELTLGKELKKIASGAFAGCTALEKVTIYATRPPSIDGTGNALFSDATYENATLYVPQGCIDKYQVMTGWSGFYTIEEMEGGTLNYLTLRQADNGEVGIVVDLGRTYKVRITAFEGWKIHSVTFNGEEVTAQLTEEGTFTTPALQADAVLNIAYEKTDNSTMVANTTARAIKVQGHQGALRITGATEGTDISVYTTDGMLVAQESAEDSETLLTLPTGQVYIVKVADKVVKIGM